MKKKYLFLPIVLLSFQWSFAMDTNKNCNPPASQQHSSESSKTIPLEQLNEALRSSGSGLTIKAEFWETETHEYKATCYLKNGQEFCRHTLRRNKNEPDSAWQAGCCNKRG